MRALRVSQREMYILEEARDADDQTALGSMFEEDVKPVNRAACVSGVQGQPDADWGRLRGAREHNSGTS